MDFGFINFYTVDSKCQTNELIWQMKHSEISLLLILFLFESHTSLIKEKNIISILAHKFAHLPYKITE